MMYLIRSPSLHQCPRRHIKTTQTVFSSCVFLFLYQCHKLNLIPLTGKPFHSNETSSSVTAQLLQDCMFSCTKADGSKYKHIYLHILLSAPLQLHIQHIFFSSLARQMVLHSCSTVKGIERHRYFEEFT